MRVLIFGAKGWIGSQIIPLLSEEHQIITADCRVDDVRTVKGLLREHTPTHVLCMIGRTHGEGCQTIDYLESPDKLQENVRDNMFAPVALALLCKELHIHLTYLGTGCIFNSEVIQNSKEKYYEYTEDDDPDFFGSNYSIVKGFTDRMMRLMPNDVLNVRIRMPITNVNHPRNFITKIISYDKVCSIPNSMTVLPSLLPYLVKLMQWREVGTINLTNPGVISHNEILCMYKAVVDPTSTWKNFSIEEQNNILKSRRSNNKLCTKRLEALFPDVPNIHVAVRRCIEQWQDHDRAPEESGAKMNGHDCVLVTGGCGAIGSEVINHLKRQYKKTTFVNVDALTYCARESSIEQPHTNYVLEYGDICDENFLNMVFSLHDPTLVIHLAAETHVDKSFTEPLQFIDTNVKGTYTLLEAARKHGNVRMFIHMSTDEVYGSVDDATVCDENTMLNPSNPYSASKAAAEMICRSYYLSFKMPIVMLRCNNAISKFQYPEKLIPKCIQCIHSMKKLPIHGTGESKRTFIHARDIATAICTVSEKGTIGEVYNIGTDMEYSVLDVVKKIFSLMRPSCDLKDWITFVADREYQDYRYNIDCTKLRALGWSPEVTFEDALLEVIKHMT